MNIFSRIFVCCALIITISAVCPAVAVPTSDEITEILKVHNAYRAEVGSPDLTWSKSLANGAQIWANHLADIGALEHSGGSGYGENLAYGSSGSSWTSIVKNLWGAEKVYFRYKPFGDASSTTGHWQDVGHYTQVIWYNTQQCGCAKATANGYTYFVCRYSPPGNWMGQYPYPVTDQIIVTSPNGGEKWEVGSTRTITWRYTGTPGSTVKILLIGGPEVEELSSATPIGAGGSGSFSWAIPATETPGTGYKIRVTSADNTELRDTSDSQFSLLTPPSLRLTYPNGGERLKRGETYTIRWEYAGNPGTVKVVLLKGSTVNRVITSGTSKGTGGSGSYRWTVPTGQATGSDYSIRVVSTSNSDCKDASDAPFSIRAK